MTARRPSAFTLIELLIVVAIIAILAAIAVPNFLTAQVRARVARVEGDFHTLFLAVESYRVDNGLISANDIFTYVHKHTPNQHAIFTTPIKYMSTQLMDPFYERNNIVWNCVGGNIYTVTYGLYHVEPMNNQGVVPGWLPAGDLLTRTAYKQSKQYLTLSTGPGLSPVPQLNNQKLRVIDAPCGIVYDLSNGVLSPGDVLGFGPP